MVRPVALLGAALLVSLLAAPAPGSEIALRADKRAEREIDAGALFERLVERYRALDEYRDTADVIYVTERDGEDPQVVESRIACELEDDGLRVETVGSQVRDAVGLELPESASPAMEALVMRYKLWLAPHMALRFTDEPLREFRVGVDEGFTATKAEIVYVGGKRLIQLDLTSGDGLSEEYTARFELYVDPATMLIERIEGEQRLHDGTQYRTTLEITPVADPIAPAA